MVADITGCKYPLDTGRGCITFITTLDLDIAVRHFQLAFEDSGIGLVTDGNKNTLQLDILCGVIFNVPDAHPRHATVITQHLIQHTVPGNRNHAFRFFFEQPVPQDFLTTQFITTMHHRHMRRDI